MTGQNADALEQLTDEFNTGQEEVRVKLVPADGYEAVFDKHMDRARGGEAGPDVVQHQETYLQQLVDSRAVIPVQGCIDATGYDTSHFLPQALDYYRVDRVQWALPFNVANLVLMYRRDAFEEVGLDPDAPPRTLEELRAAAQAFKAAGYEGGIALKADLPYLETFLALRGEPLVDKANGRTERATRVVIDTEAGREVFDYLDALVDDGLAIVTAGDDPPRDTTRTVDNHGLENLFAVYGGRAGMTIESSGSLGGILKTLGESLQSEVGVAPLPGRTEDGGVIVGGAALYLATREPARQAAAWKYMAFMASPEIQARWSAATGYVPASEGAVDLPQLVRRWREVPSLRVAYDQLLASAGNEATAGPLVGNLKCIRKAIQRAQTQMLGGDLPPTEALTRASEDANQVIQAYNANPGTPAACSS